MFSGIVKGTGRILAASPRGQDLKLVVGTAGVDLGPLAIGDSIAVNGVCLTATAVSAERFEADVSAETLARTTLGQLAAGARVNLEGSLRLGDSLDGHLVYGHVDGVGRVAGIDPAGGSDRLTIEAPAALGRYLAVKGSVAVDGVSLTVNAVTGHRFSVNIIPHTRETTVISGYATGTPVNIEADMIARYVERLIEAKAGQDAGADDGRAPLGLETLKRHGFVDSD